MQQTKTVLAFQQYFGYNKGEYRKNINRYEYVTRCMNMKTVTIRLTMMTDNVKNFVRLVNRYPYDMDLRSGRYVVDAKSILGIFSIDLSRPITMTIYSDDCDDLLRDLDGYLVKDGEETAAK